MLASQNVSEALKVYRVALGAGFDQHTAIVAAKRACDRLAYKALRTSPDTSVSGALFHSVGDREDAIKKLGTEFALFENDVMHSLGWSQDHPTLDETDPRTSWWRMNVVPILTEWQKFQTDNLGSWTTRFATSWDTFESWQQRLQTMRDAARHQGFDLASPEPQPLPKTVWDGLSAGAKEIAGAIWSLVKIVIYVLLIVGGIVFVGRFK